jgi:hypothetical protein
MRLRLIPLAVLAVALLGLSGCGHSDDAPSEDKIKAALHELNADPNTVRFETFVAESPATGQRSRQVLLLVPTKEQPGYKIVDAQGEIFDSYADFLRDNTLPDQPGPS